MPDLSAVPLRHRTLMADRADLVVSEVIDPGGGVHPPAYVAPLHIHHADDEAWYVLDGALAFLTGDDEVTVPAGGALLVPRGTPHTFWNPAPEPARYLLIVTRRIQALIDALHGGPQARVEDVFRAHAAEYLGWP